ncbi:hypothetical protein CYMTET_35297 [Cymbomonas tetramitiformis]|uniref:Cyclic nucleotide-binding domain-containing protein n=1 Tax=Cymbomonas tetramitiformis TaxID=36881 RepID=A0AAE0F9K3_9CHLO|nr:hypothetical protein CYMTET_35297 [Cymbomonas tetramitiformis]
MEGPFRAAAAAARNVLLQGPVQQKREGFFQKLVLHPNSGIVRVWDFCLLFLLTFTAFVTPVEVAFIESEDGGTGLFVLNTVIDLCFLFDILLNFFTGYYTGDELVMDAGKIRYHYIRTWFPLDLCTSIPYQLLATFSNSQALERLSITRILKLVRLAKALRVMQASIIIQRLQTKFAINYTLLRLAQFLLGSVTVMHWMACAFYMLGTLQPESWIQEDARRWVDFYELEGSAFSTKYFASLYWSAMTVCTIGYGDIVPQTTFERAFGILCMFVGASFFSYILGAVSGIMSELSASKTNFRRLMDELNNFMSHKHVNNDLRIKLREFFRFKSKYRSMRESHKLLSEMSPKLRCDVAYWVYHEDLQQCPFFRPTRAHADFSDYQCFVRYRFLCEVAVKLHEETYSPSEYICVRHTQGKAASKLYVLHKGLVVSKGLMVIRRGDFGEDALYSKDLRRFSALTLTFVVVFALYHEDLMKVLGSCPEVWKILRRNMSRRIMRERLLHYAHQTLAVKYEEENSRAKPRSSWDRIFGVYEEVATIRNFVLCQRSTLHSAARTIQRHVRTRIARNMLKRLLKEEQSAERRINEKVTALVARQRTGSLGASLPQDVPPDQLMFMIMKQVGKLEESASNTDDRMKSLEKQMASQKEAMIELKQILLSVQNRIFGDSVAFP